MVHAQEIEMQSETIGKLAEALAKAQGAIAPAQMDSENPAFKQNGRNTRYASLTAMWESARKALAENGLAVTQTTDVSESGEMVMLTTLMHTSGEWIGGVYPIRPTQNTPQGMGSAITYARRYSLSALLGLTADDDDDGNAASGKHGAPEPQQAQRQENGNGAPKAAPQQASAPQNGDKPSDAQQKALHAKGMDYYGSKEVWTLKRAELVKAITQGRSESASDLTKPEMKKLLDGLDAKIKERDALDEIPEGDNPFADVEPMAF